MGYYEPSSSLVTAADSYIVGITISLLIIIGGIGFLVWADIKKWKWHFKYYKLHSKLVLTASLLLVVLGTCLLYTSM